MKKVVFLDRDGTIIEDQDYPRDASRVEFVPNAPEGMRRMKEKGYSIVVVSNQSGVGRGIISDKQFREVHDRFCTLLKDEKIEVDEFLYCFHHPDDPCKCRKPKTGLIPKSLGGEAIDFLNSIVVGDRKSDLELGDNLGSKSYLALSGKGADTQKETTGYTAVKDLLEVADLLA